MFGREREGRLSKERGRLEAYLAFDKALEIIPLQPLPCPLSAGEGEGTGEMESNGWKV